MANYCRIQTPPQFRAVPVYKVPTVVFDAFKPKATFTVKCRYLLSFPTPRATFTVKAAWSVPPNATSGPARPTVGQIWPRGF